MHDSAILSALFDVFSLNWFVYFIELGETEGETYISNFSLIKCCFLWIFRSSCDRNTQITKRIDACFYYFVSSILWLICAALCSFSWSVGRSFELLLQLLFVYYDYFRNRTCFAAMSVENACMPEYFVMK